MVYPCGEGQQNLFASLALVISFLIIDERLRGGSRRGCLGPLESDERGCNGSRLIARGWVDGM